MRSRFISFCIFIISVNVARAQEYKYIYYLDGNFASVKPAAAAFIGKGYDDSGLFALDGFNKITGERFIKLHFTDSSLSNMQGVFQSFYPGGKRESEGSYVNSIEQGVWIKWDSAGRKTDSLIFDNGRELSGIKYSYFENGMVSSVFQFDSTVRSYITTQYDSTGDKRSVINIKGDAGTRTDYTTAGPVTAPLLTVTEEEAGFPGGLGEFRKFLMRNMDPDVPTKYHAPPGYYNVIVRFVIDKEGNVTDLVTETNYGFGMEQEALRVLRKSPKWIPAKQYGVLVNAYHRQPITFIIPAY